MPKKPSLKTLKAKLDKIFSEYVRLRDTNASGYGKCCTCVAVKFWKEMDCGHFISRRHLATRWNEYNNHIQCKHCNVFKRGELHLYTLFMLEKYGRDTVDELFRLSKQTSRLRQGDYLVMIDEYSEKVKDLRSKKNPDIL